MLVEANALLLADIPGFSTRLEAAYRIPYAWDGKGSYLARVRADDNIAGFSVVAHYAVPRLPVPPLSPPPAPLPPPPTTLEDARSMLLGFYYSFARLPAQPMAARPADSRVGHFVTRRWDFTDDFAAFPRQYVVNRWRLEKADPMAASSKPAKPITFWLDKNIPIKYRAKVEEGVLEWNKAFARIGFIDAIVVRQQPDDAEFDNNDAMHASIRWYADTSDGALATGPSRVDPRSGEILDADISFSEGWTRLPRRRAVEQLPSVAQGNHYAAARFDARDADAAFARLARGEMPAACDYEQQAMDEAAFALDLLAARGEIDPDSPEAEKIVLEQLKDVVTHEVGHTLGLTHNFRASTIYTHEQLENRAFTEVNGIAGSVMEYNALNIAPQGRPQGQYGMSTLGPYDYWAIEYAYKPLDAAIEKDVLLTIASRSKEPQLAFANDIDAGLPSVEGMDPEVTRRDLGADPLVFAARRMQLSQELWQRLQQRPLKPGEQHDLLLRNFTSAAAQVDLAATVAAKYVGGVVHLRDHGDSGRAPLNPVPAAQQRKALKLIADGLFRANSFRFKPEFVARLVPNQFDRWFGGFGDRNLAAIVNPDASLSGAVLALQRAALDRLLADGVAARILDAPAKLKSPRQAFPLAELYDTLQGAIWSELGGGGDIAPMRRNLQREHLRRVVGVLLKPAPTTPADARSLQRLNAQPCREPRHARRGAQGAAAARRLKLQWWRDGAIGRRAAAEPPRDDEARRGGQRHQQEGAAAHRRPCLTGDPQAAAKEDAADQRRVQRLRRRRVFARHCLAQQAHDAQMRGAEGAGMQHLHGDQRADAFQMRQQWPAHQADRAADRQQACRRHMRQPLRREIEQHDLGDHAFRPQRADDGGVVAERLPVQRGEGIEHAMAGLDQARGEDAEHEHAVAGQRADRRARPRMRRAIAGRLAQVGQGPCRCRLQQHGDEQDRQHAFGLGAREQCATQQRADDEALAAPGAGARIVRGAAALGEQRQVVGQRHDGRQQKADHDMQRQLRREAGNDREQRSGRHQQQADGDEEAPVRAGAVCGQTDQRCGHRAADGQHEQQRTDLGGIEAAPGEPQRPVRHMHADDDAQREEEQRQARARPARCAHATVGRASKPVKSPSANSTARWSTRAPGGPRRAAASRPAMASGVPATTASTVPSARLRTQPVAPSRAASARRK